MSQNNKGPYGFWIANEPLPPNYPEGHTMISERQVPRTDNIYGSYDFSMDNEGRYWGVSEDGTVIAWIPTEEELPIEELARRVRGRTRLYGKRN